MDYRVLIAIPCVVFVVAAFILAVGLCCKAREERAASKAAKEKKARKSLPMITCTHANAGPLRTQQSLVDTDNKRHSANADLVDVGVTSVAQTLRVVWRRLLELSFSDYILCQWNLNQILLWNFEMLFSDLSTMSKVRSRGFKSLAHTALQIIGPSIRLSGHDTFTWPAVLLYWRNRSNPTDFFFLIILSAFTNIKVVQLIIERYYYPTLL